MGRKKVDRRGALSGTIDVFELSDSRPEGQNVQHGDEVGHETDDPES